MICIVLMIHLYVQIIKHTIEQEVKKRNITLVSFVINACIHDSNNTKSDLK